ncbi:MAG: hypothetical protein EXS32_10910 [Opitutus sp.]|nr:hypothetical protein [Opitutus sp.]
MHSAPIFALGVFFALAGVALFALTMRKPKSAPEAPKKSELRDLAIDHKNTVKQRLAGAILTVFGAVIMLIS